jgi:hypothetical protein
MGVGGTNRRLRIPPQIRRGKRPDLCRNPRGDADLARFIGSVKSFSCTGVRTSKQIHLPKTMCFHTQNGPPKAKSSLLLVCQRGGFNAFSRGNEAFESRRASFGDAAEPRFGSRKRMGFATWPLWGKMWRISSLGKTYRFCNTIWLDKNAQVSQHDRLGTKCGG